MAWFSRFSRFGDVHMVFAQENTIACGLACVIMAAFKINKLVPGVKAMFDEKDILAKATALLGPNPLGAAGLGNADLVKMLNHADLKMTGWKHHKVASDKVPGKLISKIGVTEGLGPTVSSNPVIVGIDWNGGGGHWVLVDSVRKIFGKTYAIVCDPWDGNVHVTEIEKKTDFAYTGQAALAVDFGGTRHSYDSPSVGGAFIGDLIYR